MTPTTTTMKQNEELATQIEKTFLIQTTIKYIKQNTTQTQHEI